MKGDRENERLKELEKECYFRFQNPKRELTSESKSWGMIYMSEKEAIEEGSYVLEGKSCVSKPTDLIDWMQSYNNSYVILAFKGEYVGEGHDGEDVVKFREAVEVYDFDEFFNIFLDDEGYIDRDIYEEAE
jgi:hypothetical protein